MNRNQKQDSNINYELDSRHSIAKIVDSSYCNENIIIPRSIKVNSQEYLVTSIETGAFCESNIKSVSFPNNSALKTIKSNSFSSDLKNLYIPSSVENLEDGWCEYTDNLINITISPNNKRYKIYEKNNYYFIIGKSDMNKEKYDELIFVLRNIEIKSILLPDNIQNIKPFAFQSCNINSIKTTEHSWLKSILANSFCQCSIESLIIPPSFEKFEDGWCKDTYNLKKVTISSFNKFYKKCEENNNMILGKSDRNSEIFDDLVFVSREINYIRIPNYIKNIKPYACQNCTISDDEYDRRIMMNNNDYSCFIEFQEESKLENIGEYAFSHSRIKKITIPKSVYSIGEGAFENCSVLESFELEIGTKLKSIQSYLFFQTTNLKNINIPENSLISSIGFDVLSDSQIESLYIPSNVEELKKGWCSGLEKLANVTISPLNKHFMNCKENNKLILGKSNKNINNFDVIVFACRDIKNPIIPKHIKKIQVFSFQLCLQLETVIFEKDSQLQSIKPRAFGFSKLKGISVPEKVHIIKPSIFEEAINFECAEFLANKMKFLETFNFSSINIKIISFPNVQALELKSDFCHYPLRNIPIFVSYGAQISFI